MADKEGKKPQEKKPVKLEDLEPSKDPKGGPTRRVDIYDKPTSNMAPTRSVGIQGGE